MRHLFGPINKNTRGPFGVHVNILFEPRDLWIGLYLKEPYDEMGDRWMTVYLTIIPMLPLQITIRLREWEKSKEYRELRDEFPDDEPTYE